MSNESKIPSFKEFLLEAIPDPMAPYTPKWQSDMNTRAHKRGDAEAMAGHQMKRSEVKFKQLIQYLREHIPNEYKPRNLEYMGNATVDMQVLNDTTEAEIKFGTNYEKKIELIAHIVRKIEQNGKLGPWSLQEWEAV
jgi:hypothetical protein